MGTIADNAYYTIETSTTLNRIYITVKGFWQNKTTAPDYLKDIERATRDVTSGFMIVADVTQMKVAPKEVGEIHMHAQRIMVAAGLKATAEVLPEDVLAQYALKRFSEESGMKKGSFKSKEDAEKWLDGLK